MMRTLIYFGLLMLLIACNNSASNDSSAKVDESSQVEKEGANGEETVTVEERSAEEPQEEMAENSDGKSTESIVETVYPEPIILDTIKGYYSYFAEVGYFKDCADGTNYLVRLRKSTVQMESDYLKLMKESNEKIFVKVKGHIDLTGKEKVFVVDQYIGFFPEEGCE